MTDPVSTERLEEMLADARESLAYFRGVDGSPALIRGCEEHLSVLTELLASRQAPEGDGLEVEGLSIPGVDSQVILAMAELDGAQTINPAWLWFEDEHNHMSLGRWQSVPCQAPYIRGDLVLAALSAERARGEELTRERDEARRRRDEWRKKADGYEEVRLALREKVGSPWPPNMSRVLWAGIAADERSRADASEAEVKRLREALEKISCPSQTEGLLWWQVEARAALTKKGGNGE